MTLVALEVNRAILRYGNVVAVANRARLSLTEVLHAAVGALDDEYARFVLYRLRCGGEP